MTIYNYKLVSIIIIIHCIIILCVGNTHGATGAQSLGALKVEGGRRDHAPKGGNLSRTIETRNTGHEEPARGYGRNADRRGNRAA